MGWLGLIGVVALLAALGVLVSVNRLRLAQRIASEVRTLLAVPPSDAALRAAPVLRARDTAPD